MHAQARCGHVHVCNPSTRKCRLEDLELKVIPYDLYYTVSSSPAWDRGPGSKYRKKIRGKVKEKVSQIKTDYTSVSKKTVMLFLLLMSFKTLGLYQKFDSKSM